MAERELGVDFAFGFAHVAHEDEAASVGKDFFQSGESAADAGVVGHVTIFIEGYVEVNAYDCLFTGKIVIFDVCHFFVYFLSCVFL